MGTPAPRWPSTTTEPLAAEFARIAEALVANPPPVVSMDGCSARMLERVEAAVAAGDTA